MSEGKILAAGFFSRETLDQLLQQEPSSWALLSVFRENWCFPIFLIGRTLLLEEDFEEEPEEDRGVNFTTECVFGLGYTFTRFLQVLGLDIGPIMVFLTLTK